MNCNTTKFNIYICTLRYDGVLNVTSETAKVWRHHGAGIVGRGATHTNEYGYNWESGSPNLYFTSRAFKTKYSVVCLGYFST